MTYRAECWPIRKQHVQEISVGKIKVGKMNQK